MIERAFPRLLPLSAACLVLLGFGTTARADERMPDAKSGKRLTPRQIAVLKKWIEQGAEWKGHCAYLKVERPEVPAVDEPGFVRNPVDRFLLAKLKDAGLPHAPEADRV